MTEQQETPAVAEVSHPAGGSPEGVAVFTVPLDSPPSIGAYRSEDHKYWHNGRGPLPSVTTVLELLNKPGVTVGKAQETARVCMRRWMELSEILEREGEDAAAKWAVARADEKRDNAAKLGTSIHILADMEGMAPGASEKPVEPSFVSAEEMLYLEAFRHFLSLYGAENIVSSEKMVWSQDGYAGTYDLLMQLPCGSDHSEGQVSVLGCPNPELWLLDIKTSRTGPYPEWGLQLAAYRWADSIILENDPRVYPMPLVHRTGVLHLRPDLYPKTGWRLIEYPTDTQDYEAFLHVLRFYEWQKQGRFTKSRLLGRRQKEWRKPIGTSDTLEPHGMDTAADGISTSAVGTDDVTDRSA